LAFNLMVLNSFAPAFLSFLADYRLPWIITFFPFHFSLDTLRLYRYNSTGILIYMTALKISGAVSLAIHTIVVLAANPGKTVSAGEMAGLLNASKNHLAKVLQRLVKGGFVESTRGPKGGFTLARPTDGVTLLEVFEYIEGPFEVRDCLLDEQICGVDKCAMGEHLFDANIKLKKFMSDTTLAVIAESFMRNVKNAEE
jgi:Rrf2 family protein